MRSTDTSAVATKLAHTSGLDRGTLRTVRALLDDVFGAGMTDHAWDHALGGMHALVWEAGQLVAHGSVVQRRLLHARRALRAGYVEAVAVRADRRGCGYGALVMDTLEQVVHGAYEVGGLGASEMGAGFYRHRGWRPWEGRTWALAPSGLVRTTEGDGGVYVLEAGVALDVSGDLTCDWRDGDVW
jgi:aminoglycoside 2'-N-acetyltransferase I